MRMITELSEHMPEFITITVRSGQATIRTADISAVVVHNGGSDIHMKSGTIFTQSRVKSQD